MLQKNTPNAKPAHKGNTRETIIVILQALAIALVFRTFAWQTFYIPSSSMKDTLLVGDLLFVSKYAYGYSRYSFPADMIPFSGRFFASPPKRGDVAVFRVPQDDNKDYIKRVIGLPGDKIRMINGILHINGKAVGMKRIANFDETVNGVKYSIPRYEETLPNGVRHDILDEISNAAFDNTRTFEVPKNHYFMMGDNRDNSSDSRGSVVRFVHKDQFVGRADLIFLSIEEGNAIWAIWKWPWTMRWSRIFSEVQ